MHSCTKFYYHFRNFLLHRSMNGTTSSAHKNLNKFNFEDNIAKLKIDIFSANYFRILFYQCNTCIYDDVTKYSQELERNFAYGRLSFR